MDTLIIVVPLLAVIAYQGFLILSLQSTHDKVQRDLLDRVLARNYETFVQAQAVRAEAERKPLTLEEIHRLQEEQGIPV